MRGRIRDVHAIERQLGGLQAVVVTGDAVLIKEGARGHLYGWLFGGLDPEPPGVRRHEAGRRMARRPPPSPPAGGNKTSREQRAFAAASVCPCAVSKSFGSFIGSSAAPGPRPSAGGPARGPASSAATRRAQSA